MTHSHRRRSPRRVHNVDRHARKPRLRPLRGLKGMREALQAYRATGVWPPVLIDLPSDLTTARRPPLAAYGILNPQPSSQGCKIMTSELSAETIAMLKARAGQGVSKDAALLLRSKVRLLANTSKLPRHGQGRPGLYQLADEGQTCVAKMRVVPAILYSVYVEKTPDDKFAGRDYLALPPDVAPEGYVWRCRNGNFLEFTPRLAGVFAGLEAEFDFSGTASKVARAFNTEATGRLDKLKLPLGATAWELGAQELLNTRQQPYWSPTYAYLASAGENGGPSESEAMRAMALSDLVAAALAEAQKEAGERAQPAIDNRPAGRIEFSTGASAPAKPLIDDDEIPF
jgi:hypothetical protein